MRIMEREYDMRVLKPFRIFPFPGGLVDEGKVGTIVFGVTLGAFRFMGFREIIMVSRMRRQLLSNLRMAAQTAKIHAFGRVAFFAVHDKGRPRHGIVGARERPG